MKLIVLICCVLMIAGCAEQPGDDWYDQAVDGKAAREAYIEHQVESGLDPKDARNLYDRRTWEMNTINLSREGEKPE